MKEITIFVLQDLIKEEKLDELKQFIPHIKASELEQEFKRQYSTANLSNAIEHLIKTPNLNNREVFEVSFELGLQYLENRNLGQLIKQTVLSQKIDYYHHIKEKMDESRFNSIQVDEFLTMSSAFNSYPHPAFHEWIKNVNPPQEQLRNHIRASIVDKRMNIDYLDSYLLKVDNENKKDVIYECLAYSSVGKTHTDRLCHLFNLILPEINKPLLLNKLKHTINLAEAKDLRLATDSLERFCEVFAGHRPGNISVLLQLVNSYNLNTSLNEQLADTEKKPTYKSPKI
jgi:hypothetical protein